MIAIRQCPRSCLLAAVLLAPMANVAQSPSALAIDNSEAAPAREFADPETDPDYLPDGIAEGTFSALLEHSPFLRSLNLPNSLILTGVARIEDETVATMLDVESLQSYTLSDGEVSDDGWQLVEVKGDPDDFETLTAKVKVDGTEVISIRYRKNPLPMRGGGRLAVSGRVGNGSPGGGTGPHGGPDPKVLTPDQWADARNGARNIRDGFQADGYPNNSTVPPAVVSKLSRLSVQQREQINVQMYEYRNRGLGMQERQQIYNRLLDRELQRR